MWDEIAMNIRWNCNGCRIELQQMATALVMALQSDLRS